MRKTAVYLFFIIGLNLSLATAQTKVPDYLWPTNASRALTSSFAESRSGRFHAGIDVKTWGREGYPIYAVRDGYVSRLRVSPFGYGRAIYLTLDTGEVVVYGHLSRFVDRLAAAVDAEQDKYKRYAVNLWLNQNRFVFKQGDLLGYTGQSGVGYPHLHFEMRDSNGHPINPLSKGYVVDDSLPPTLRQVFAQPLDAYSTVDNDWRTKIVSLVAEGKGRYRLERKLVVSGKIGFGLSAFDTMDGISNKFGTYQNQLWIDDQLIFQSTYDRFPYALNQQLDLDRDFRLRVQDLGSFYKLYRDVGNRLGFYLGSAPYYGAVYFVAEADSAGIGEVLQESGVPVKDLVRLPLGEHALRFVARDFWGNESVINGRIIAAPPVSPSPASFLPSMHASDQDLQFDVQCEYYDTYVRLALQASADLVGLPVLTGWNTHGEKRQVALLATGLRSFVGAWDLSREIAQPIAFEISYQDGAGHQSLQSWTLPVSPIARGANKKIKSDDGQTTLVFSAGSLYRDLYLRKEIVDPDSLQPYAFISRVYRFDPRDVPLDGGVELQIQLPEGIAQPQQIGVYTLVGANRWVFLGNRLDNERRLVSTSIRGLGDFCLLRDDQVPEISGLVPTDGRHLLDRQPKLQARVQDALSGLKNEPSMAMLLDGERVVAEFDPESQRLFHRPRTPLSLGRHDVRVNVEDRSGNVSSVTHVFWIDAAAAPVQKSGE